MTDKRNSISRKDALKRLGSLALGIPLGIPMASSAISKPARSTAGFPNIISHRKRDKPNILWITTEGVPLSVLSCYGSRVMHTPNIDRIANEGMLFHNSFCTNALCAPSRATLLTGKYSHLNGMLVNPGGTTNYKPTFFDPSQETFVKILKRAGYKTGLVGKWHLRSSPGVASNPGEAGFDYFVYKQGAGGPYYNSKGFFQNPALGSKEIQQREYTGYITDTFTDLTIKGIEQLKEPFCLALQYFNAHRPFEPPHKYTHIYDNVRFPEPGTFWDDYSYRSTAVRRTNLRIADMPDFNPPKDYTRRQCKQFNYQHLMRHLLGTLKAQDDNIGRLLDYLDKTGLVDNTIVVFTGDHGFFLGEHGWFDKRLMYEESIRVPWMIRYPGSIKPGSSSSSFVVNIDNAPTILDMLGLPVPQDMQGKSLVPFFKGQTPEDWRTSMYYHFYEDGPPLFYAMANYGIRTERYKLINYYNSDEWELFDLERDPDEMESLVSSLRGGMQVKEGYEQVVKDLLDQLIQLRKKYKDNTGKPVNFPIRKGFD